MRIPERAALAKQLESASSFLARRTHESSSDRARSVPSRGYRLGPPHGHQQAGAPLPGVAAVGKGAARASKLRSRGYLGFLAENVADTLGRTGKRPNASTDSDSQLNVLDRTDKPQTMFRRRRRPLFPGTDASSSSLSSLKHFLERGKAARTLLRSLISNAASPSRPHWEWFCDVPSCLRARNSSVLRGPPTSPPTPIPPSKYWLTSFSALQARFGGNETRTVCNTIFCNTSINDLAGNNSLKVHSTLRTAN